MLNKAGDVRAVSGKAYTKTNDCTATLLRYVFCFASWVLLAVSI